MSFGDDTLDPANQRANQMDIIERYEEVTTKTGLYPEAGTGSLIAINYCCLGLGEAGELQGKLKKVWRGDATLAQTREALIDEAGDVLWYLTRLTKELGIGLERLMQLNATKTLDRKARGVTKGSGDYR